MRHILRLSSVSFRILVVALVLAPLALAAAPVALDTTFGTGGIAATAFAGAYDELRAVRIQSDGKIVAAGSSSSGFTSRFVVVRYNTNGSLDSTFGEGGRVSKDQPNNGSGAEGLAIQADGKILVAGSANGTQGFVLLRYNADGTPDASFGANGEVTAWPSGPGQGLPFSIAVQPDGKIVVGGYGRGPISTDNDFIVARYTSAGVLDTTFNGNGVVVLPLSSGDDYGNAIALQSDGKVVIAGHSQFGSDYRFVIARLDADGAVDTTFGCSSSPCAGANSISVGYGFNIVRGVVVQPDGRLVIGGMDYNGGAMAAARFNTDGTIDTTFGCASGPCTGWATMNAALAEDIRLQPDGRILLAGYAGSPAHVAVFRLESNGTPDTTFGTGGRAVAAITSATDSAYALAVQADGKLVAAGFVEQASRNMALVRFLANGAVDTSFGTAGEVATDMSNAAVARALVRQPDGKLLAVGSTGAVNGNDMAIARFNADGSLDTSFGCASAPCTGRATLAFFSENDEALAVGVQSDGRIVLAGSTVNGGNLDFAVLRLTTSGVLDTTFGCTLPPCSGKVTFGYPGATIEGVNALQIQPNGRIVLAGYSQGAGGNDFVVARLTAAGLFDTSFGCASPPCSGRALVDVAAGGSDTAWALALQADAKIVVAGEAIRPGFGPDMGVIRLNANGTLDTAFGAGGIAYVNFGGYPDIARAVIVLADGKVLVGGSGNSAPSTAGFGIARLNADGSLDSTFGTGGKVIAATGTVTSLTSLPGGRFLAAGYASTGTNLDWTAMRFLPGGQLDATFGTNGKFFVPLTSRDDNAWAAALQPDGRLVMAGVSDGFMTLARITSVLPGPADFDFDGDLHADILWSNTASGATYVWYMAGTPPALQTDAFVAQIDPTWQVQGIADFNGDGKPDLVWRNTADGNCYVWYMNGVAFIGDAFVFSLPPQWVIQGVADFNADGKPDFLMRNIDPSSGVGFAWFFDNATPIGDQYLFGIDPAWKVEAVADLTADGQPDLLFRYMDPKSGLAFVWKTQYSGGNLSLGAASSPVFAIDPVWEVVQLADWNADGRPDLLFRNADSGVVFVWYLGDDFALGASDFIIQIDPSWEIVPRR